MTHSLGLLLCLCETLHYHTHSITKEARGENGGVEKFLVYLLEVCQGQPEVPLEDHQEFHGLAIACAALFVAIRAKSVAVCSFLTLSGVGCAVIKTWRSLDWDTWGKRALMSYRSDRPEKMTLQWTAVALFLYAEIGILLLLCLPFVSAQRWQTIFNLGVWNHVAWIWKKGFLAMIIILIVLFLDAVREVRKYSGTAISKDSKMYQNQFDHVHMKLFRSQRNLYISGFALLLWLVMRRVITMINQLAVAANTNSALQLQLEDANQAAKKYTEESERLKQALNDSSGDKRTAQENKDLRKEVCKLKQELETSAKALISSKSEAESIKKQTEALAKNYDHLLQRQNELQIRTESEDKKDV